jgi:hypothetical protein
MKLTERAIGLINNRRIILKLALVLDFTELWINKLIAANKEDAALTSATALKVIREETGLTDSEILEEEKATA